MLSSEQFNMQLQNIIDAQSESEKMKLVTQLASQYNNDIMELNSVKEELTASNTDRDNYKKIATDYWKTSITNKDNQQQPIVVDENKNGIDDNIEFGECAEDTSFDGFEI